MPEFDEIYDTMTGALIPEACIPWVENAFAEGSFCDQAYGEVYDAYERLRDRLGVVDEDEDVEIIISRFMDMQRDLCQRIFLYGQEYESHRKDMLDEAMINCMKWHRPRK